MRIRKFLCRRDVRTEIGSIAVLVIFFVLLYRDIVFFPHLIVSVDMSWPAFNPGFLAFVSPWIPPNLGYYVTGGSWWMIIWGMFTYGTGGNIVLSQKLIYCAPLLSSITMYFFLRNHVCRNHLVILLGAMFYAYSPEAVAESVSPIIWGYALIPLTMNYLLNIINPPKNIINPAKTWLRDPLILAIVMELTASMTLGMQWMIFFALATGIFLLLRVVSFHERVGYLKHILKNAAIVLLVFFAISWSLSWSTYLFYTKGPDVPFVPPGISQFVINYREMSVLNSLRLVGTGFNSFYEANIFNFLFPILAFLSLLIIVRMKHRLLVAVSSIMCIVLLSFGLIAREGGSTLELLLKIFPMASALRGPEKVILPLTFFYAVLISIAIYDFILWFGSKYPVAVIIKWPYKASYSGGQIVGLGLATLLVVATFSYIAMPTNPRFQEGVFSKVPDSYSQAIEILMNSSGEDFRYFPIPYTILTGNTLASAFQNYFYSNLGTGYSSTQSYVEFVSDALTENKTANLGALLAPGNTKYVFVLRDAVELGSSQWMVQGSPRRDGGYLVGEPDQYIPLLNQQSDLQLVGNTDSLLTYENLGYLPHIAVLPSLTYVVGDRDALLALTNMPGYHINDSAILFGEQQPSLELLQASSDVVFYERSFSDLVLSFLVADYGQSLWQYGQSESITWVNSLPNWTQSNPLSRYYDSSLSAGSFFTYGNGYLETTGAAAVNVPFATKSGASYDLWVRVLQSPSSKGTLNFKLDGSPLSTTLATNSNVFKGFVWVNLGTYTLSAASHLLSIKNDGGFSAIDTLLVAPSSKVAATEQKISSALQGKTVVFAYSTLDGKEKTESNPIPNYLNATSWAVQQEQVAIDVNSQESNFTVHVTSSNPSANQVFLLFTPPSPQNWNAYDYLQIPVYSTTSSISINLYDKSHQLIDARGFNVEPNNWSLISYMIDKTRDYSGVGQLQIIANSAQPNTYFYVGKPLLQTDIGFLMNVSLQIPQDGKYLLALSSSGPTSSETGFFANNTEIYNSTELDGWVESSGINLQQGFFNFSALSTNQLSNGLFIITNAPSVNQLFKHNEATPVFSVETTGPNQYKVTVSGAPSFVVLGESFHAAWTASTSNGSLLHFPSYSLTNGFYLNSSAKTSIELSFNEGSFTQLDLSAIRIAFLAIAICLIIYTSIPKAKLKVFRKYTFYRDQVSS